MSLAQLSRLLPLPDSELQQILEYAATLSKKEAVDHFANFLGDTPQAIEFISSFNSHRADPAVKKPADVTTTIADGSGGSQVDVVPRSRRGQKKKKSASLHTPAPRRVADIGPAVGTAYKKKDLEDDYMTGRPGTASPANAPAVSVGPPAATPPPPQPRPPGAGTLVSELGLPKAKQKAKPNPVSRTSTPGPGPGPGPGPRNAGSAAAGATKISIAGGTPMHGASTALADLDDAIRSLELSTDSAEGTAARRCNCVAARHPLQTAAPNCLSCGKVICVKEGLGPCTFCGSRLLGPDEVQAMIRELKMEKGREKMAANREAHRRPEVATTPRPFASRAAGEAESKAREHRDRLLGFQAQNARRTTVRDEAADFDVATTGSIWASPEERARELKRQQKLLREMEWNARPDYEKRKQVLSIDLVGKKVVRKMAAVERPPSPERGEAATPGASGARDHALGERDGNRGSGGGAFSRNPLLGGVIKPIYDVKGKGAELEGRKDRNTRWRRVQDDLDDNEAVILDGGVYGGEG